MACWPSSWLAARALILDESQSAIMARAMMMKLKQNAFQPATARVLQRRSLGISDSASQSPRPMAAAMTRRGRLAKGPTTLRSMPSRVRLGLTWAQVYAPPVQLEMQRCRAQVRLRGMAGRRSATFAMDASAGRIASQRSTARKVAAKPSGVNPWRMVWAMRSNRGVQ